MTKQQLIDAIKKELNPNLDVDVFSNQLEIYKSFLQQENEKYNLTRLDGNEIIWSQYYYQSVVSYKKLKDKKFVSILDIGSGSGNPGVILKLIWPKTEVTIIESSTKKANFISQLVKLLNLDNVSVLNVRAEEYVTESKKKFDIVTARAVAPTEQLLEILIPYAEVSGLIVVPKSKNYLSEVKDLDKLLSAMKCELLFIDSFISEEHENNVLYIIKKQPTPRKYHRTYAQIKKGFDYGK